ncbi:MAG: AsmA family protein [Candidatus Manganitrophaceae bacterium]|nr:MAG: AsmA family protein [Candidatus Manganitrophaceae bacterium]
MRRAATILGGIFLILFLILLLAPFLVDLSFLKSRFLPQVESALGRGVDVGSIRLSLWPLGVQVKEVVVRDDPQFSPEDFLRSESVVVSFRLLPLLQKRVEVSQLLIQRPAVHLIQDANGRLNTSTLGKGGGPKPPSEGTSAPQERRPIGIAADKVLVKNGRITYVRRVKGGPPLSSAAENFDLTLSNLQLGEIASVDLETRLEPQGKQGSLRGRVGPLTTALKPETIDLSGTVGRSDLHLRGGFQKGRLVLTANAQQVDLDELMLLLPQREPPEKPPRSPDQSPPSSGTTPMEVDFNLKKVQVKGMEVADLSGRAKLNRKGGALENLNGNIWGGHFTGAGRVDLSSGAFPFSTTFALQAVSLGSVIKQFVPINPDLFSGSASIQMGLKGSGGSWGALSKTLTGEGRWEVEEGEIQKVNLLAESLSILHVLDRVSLPMEPNTRFSSAKGAFKIDAGRIGLNDLSMNNPLFDLLGKGEVQLDGLYRVIGEMRLAESLTRQIQATPAGSLLPVREGRVEVPIEIAGGPQNARLAVREEALKETAAEQLRKRLSERLEKEGLGGMLQR